MLKITKKVEYALIAVRHLQENKEKLIPKIISNIIKHKKNLSWNNFNKELLKNRHE